MPFSSSVSAIPIPKVGFVPGAAQTSDQAPMRELSGPTGVPTQTSSQPNDGLNLSFPESPNASMAFFPDLFFPELIKCEAAEENDLIGIRLTE